MSMEIVTIPYFWDETCAVRQTASLTRSCGELSVSILRADY